MKEPTTLEIDTSLARRALQRILEAQGIVWRSFPEDERRGDSVLIPRGICNPTPLQFDLAAFGNATARFVIQLENGAASDFVFGCLASQARDPSAQRNLRLLEIALGTGAACRIFYLAPRSDEEIRIELRNCAGSQFDFFLLQDRRERVTINVTKDGSEGFQLTTLTLADRSVEREVGRLPDVDKFPNSTKGFDATMSEVLAQIPFEFVADLL